MTKKLLAFDLEIAKGFPSGDWSAHRPLGVTCAATLPADTGEPRLWLGRTGSGDPAPRMSRAEAGALVEHLSAMVRDGYTIITWNGLAFDFDVLAEESGAYDECSRLAAEHVDLMFHVLCVMGYPVAIDRVAEGMGIAGKLEGMSGAEAPGLWAAGEVEKVLAYVTQDVRMLSEVAEVCAGRGQMRWVTRKGKLGRMALSHGWLNVRDAARLPLPDTSWMDDPMPRERFYRWLRAPFP